MKNALTKGLHFLTSLRLAVVCMLLLFILIFWGTLYQVDHGIHAAQQRFFYSWFVWLGGFVPLPGGMLVMWVFFINLFLSMMIHFQYGWRRLGILFIHAGILLMLAGGWVTHLFGEESFLTLREGEASNVSTAYREWEISVWKDADGPRAVDAYDADGLKAGDALPFEQHGLTLHVETYHSNARAFKRGDGDPSIVNASGINSLQPAKSDKESERDLPACQFRVSMEDGREIKLILFGGEVGPAVLSTPQGELNIQLRRKRFPLPLVVQLLDFQKSFHPNSEIPRHFSSRINVIIGDLKREALVRMNHPFRHRGYTFFQASYGKPENGREVSTFAVTRNIGRLVPYVATGVVVLGLLVHFLLELVRPRKPLREEVS